MNSENSLEIDQFASSLFCLNGLNVNHAEIFEAHRQPFMHHHSGAVGRMAPHPANGSFSMIVSSRSGEVLSSTTGASTSSSMRRTYFTASAGNSA